MDVLYHPDRRAWREAAGEALVASRGLGAVAARFAPDVGNVTRQFETLSALVDEPRRIIVDALTRLLQFVPVTAEDELVVQEARMLRDVAANLLSAPKKTPVVDAEAAKTGATAAVEPGARRYRVLVAEDERAVRDVLRRHLARLKYDVVEAEDGADALDIARRERVDLVLTDINMPRLTGVQLLKALKTMETTRDIPVVVISSQDDMASVIECIEHGAEDLIGKPYHPELLGARVRASLERKRLRDLERMFRFRVGQLTAAAEAVEREQYLPGALDSLAAQGDELGRLARVFDRMVGGLRSREERLQRRVTQLRSEIGQALSRGQPESSTSAVSAFATGEVICARYEILATIGEGGMGRVYRARDRELDEEVAMKVVRGELLKSDPTLVERLRSEIRLTRRISHRNVVRAHDIGEANGTYFITMEFVHGITVEQLIDRRGRLSVESTLAIGTQLAEALVVAHGMQVMHRDIKPANLLIDHGGVLKVADFGIARLMEPDEKKTRSGFVLGTPQYMSPEQALGRPVDVRSDLYAMGAILYECLAGRPPYVADSLAALVSLAADRTMIPLREFVPGVPEGLDALISQLLQFEADDRPASSREVLARLADTEHGTDHAPAFILDDIDLQIVEDIH
jgi:DNA-binding response OmpR family regulator